MPPMENSQELITDEPDQSGFETFFEDNEYFSHAEFGWAAGQDRFWFDNVHLSAWHSDRREEANTPAGWGVLFSGTMYVDDEWLPFLRAGWSEGEASLLNASVAVGFGRYVRSNGDLIGFGMNWGKPSGDGLDDQFTSELFYRLQVSPNFAITPDLQLLVNPANNPDEDLVAVFGIRGRLAL